jgi:hypothetical protein
VPYVVIEGVFVVPADSGIATLADVDREQVRISIWETRPGVTPMVSASWAWVRPRCLRSSASRCA